MELRNKRWSEEEFLEKRKEVLSWWPTGKELTDLDESVEYWRRLPDEKILVKQLRKARNEGRILVQANTGHATIEESIEQMKYVQQRGVDIHSFYTDTYSRKNRFDKAQRGLEESLRQGRSLMNGCPIVNYGLGATRRVSEAIDAPIIFSTGDEEPLLLQEMALAAGFSSNTGDVEALAKFCKDYPLEKGIQNRQYTSRLMGYYTERGAPVDCRLVGNLCGWDPPGIKIVTMILSSLLTAEQGVKYISLVPGLTCNLIQDIAAPQVCRELTERYLSQFGYDVAVTLSACPFQGDWPKSQERMSAMTAWSSALQVLAGVDFVQVKSLDEAAATPTKEATAAAAMIARQLIALMGKQRFPESAELKIEKEMIKLEVKAIVDKVIELGDGDIAVGEVRAVEQGVIDAAFSPWGRLAGKVLPVRDSKGAIRYLDHGNLPLPKEVIEYHRQKIAEREKEEGRKSDIEMVAEDITYVSSPIVKEIA